MARDEYLFTSESVTEGHPDKIADQISDAVLDSILAQDPVGRVACETLLTTGLVVVAGEITTYRYVDIPQDRARDDQERRIHPRAKFGFDYRDVRRHRGNRFPVARHRDGRGQSGGAGDQGLMFGYACTRDRRAHANADHARAQARPTADGPPQTGSSATCRPEGRAGERALRDGKPVSVETSSIPPSTLTTGLVVVAGEVTNVRATSTSRKIVRETIRNVGYTRAKFGFDYETCGVIAAIDAVARTSRWACDKLGAGDQGLMFGYACRETEELMPLPIMLAHKLVQRLTEVRRNGELDYLRPDGKSQVSVRYVDGKPVSVETVVVSTAARPGRAAREDPRRT